MTTMNLADTIIMFVGFYFLVSTAMMKVHGRVNRMLISKKYDPQKARDLPGFISCMYLPNLVIGFVTMAVGAAHFVVADILGKEDIGIYIYMAYVILFVIYAFGSGELPGACTNDRYLLNRRIPVDPEAAC